MPSIEPMNFKQLTQASRSRRRFDEDAPVSIETLRDLVDCARLAPSGKNMQPLKFALVADKPMCDRITSLCGWAAALKDWKGPEVGERPRAYIVVLLDSTVAGSPGCDHGIAAQTVMLGAAAQGLGGCILGNNDQKGIAAALEIDKRYEVLLALALGVPAEEVVIEPLPSDGKITYWRTSDGRHHVPKRSLEELVVAERR